jgi:hypothetical protein
LPIVPSLDLQVKSECGFVERALGSVLDRNRSRRCDRTLVLFEVAGDKEHHAE